MVFRAISKQGTFKALSSIALFFGFLVGSLAAEENTNSQPAEALPRQARIGMLLPLSGTYAAVGEDNRKGIEAALQEIGHPDWLQTIYADSRADPTQAASEFRKLTEAQDVQAIFAFRGPVGMALNPLSNSLGVPLFGGVANKDFVPGSAYAFQVWPRSDQEGRYLLDHIADNDVGSIAVFTSEDDYLVSVSASFKERAMQRGMRITLEQLIPPSENDFRTLIARLKQGQPDAVFVNLGISQIGPFIRQLRQLQVSSALYSNFWAAKPEVQAAANLRAGEEVHFVEIKSDLPSLPAGSSGATVSAYVTTLLFWQAAMHAELPLSRERIYQSLLKQTEVESKGGNFPIIDRCVQFPLQIGTIRGR